MDFDDRQRRRRPRARVTASSNAGVSRRALMGLAGLITAVSVLLGTASGLTGANWADEVLGEGAFQAGLAYGSFVHTDDQVISTAFTSAPMAFSKGDQYFGISPVASDGSECSFDGNNCTKLCVNQDGMYDIAFSAQFAEETNENVRIAIWLWKAAAATPFAPPTTKDPNNVPWTGSEGLLTKQVKRSIYAWNFLQRASAGECFALLWAIDTNTTITMASETTLGPGVIRSQVPSLILTIEQMG